MREILFRAKTEPNCKDVMNGKIIKNPKWIYGYVDLGYMHDCKAPLISDKNGNKTYKCQYETIGQFTGLTDKNGKKVFEGDVLKFTDTNADYEWIGKVEFGNPNAEYNWGFQLVYISGTKANVDILMWFDMEECGAFSEVIGNIHDNPELLEVQ